MRGQLSAEGGPEERIVFTSQGSPGVQPNRTVRLVDGPTPHEGIVQVMSPGASSEGCGQVYSFLPYGFHQNKGLKNKKNKGRQNPKIPPDSTCVYPTLNPGDAPKNNQTLYKSPKCLIQWLNELGNSCILK